MSSATTPLPDTKKLEPALRYLARHPGTKITALAQRFAGKQQASEFKAELWAWLTRYNQARPDLPGHVIDGVLASKAAAAPKVNTDLGRVRSAAQRVVGMDSPRKPAPVLPSLKGPNGEIGSWLSELGLKPVVDVVSYQVAVSPAVATQWLTLNQGNRNPSKAKIRRFAAAIKAGRWTLNGESIKFSESGRLLDGQSRLRAIVEADTAITLEVRGGLPDATQQTMDVGEARKGAHMLEMLGEKYANIAAPALKLLHHWETASLGYNSFGSQRQGSIVLENSEIGPLLQRHAGIRASVGWCVSIGHKVAHLMPPSEAAFFHYVFGLAGPKKRDAFFDAVANGLGLTASSPAYHLRERLQADRAAQARMMKRERYALVIKAWNAHYAGESVSRLVFRNTGETRENFPVIAGIKGGETK